MKTETSVKWLIKSYMLGQRIDSIKELANKTGIDYQTLREHIKRPELFRTYEIRTLNEVLNFNDEDLLILVKEGT